MCGISAVILADPKGMACPDLFESLGLLQHRGQVNNGDLDEVVVVSEVPTNTLFCRTPPVLSPRDLRVVFSSAKETAWFETFLTKSSFRDSLEAWVSATVNIYLLDNDDNVHCVLIY